MLRCYKERTLFVFRPVRSRTKLSFIFSLPWIFSAAPIHSALYSHRRSRSIKLSNRLLNAVAALLRIDAVSFDRLSTTCFLDCILLLEVWKLQMNFLPRYHQRQCQIFLRNHNSRLGHRRDRFSPFRIIRKTSDINVRRSRRRLG
jgi:hypothetical protein